MRVFYDKEKSLELMERIQKQFSRKEGETSRGKEIHVSDVIGCEVAAYCRIKNFPSKITKQGIGLMVFGIIAQRVLQWTYPKEWREWESRIDIMNEEETIFGHIDVFEEEKFPLEAKASRKKIFKSDQIPDYYLKQIMAYMAMEGAEKGWIVIFNVFSCQIMAFQIVMNATERLAKLALMTGKAAKIRQSILEDKPDILTVTGEEYGGCNYINDCPRVAECFEKWKVLKEQKREEEKKWKKKSPLD